MAAMKTSHLSAQFYGGIMVLEGRNQYELSADRYRDEVRQLFDRRISPPGRIR
jgi:hypothetical protein